jgi:hypothetical protein
MNPSILKAAAQVITAAGLNPNDFCVIRNQCFSKEEASNKAKNSLTLAGDSSLAGSSGHGPFWYLGSRFFQVTKSVAEELADWFEDPTMVSDWLVNQQERMVFNQPLVRPRYP